jgi:hypothetical protein
MSLAVLQIASPVVSLTSTFGSLLNILFTVLIKFQCQKRFIGFYVYLFYGIHRTL